MSDDKIYGPRRIQTRPTPRAELAPISSSQLPVADDEPAPVTMVCCVWCAKYGGRGMVPPKVAAAWLECYPELRPADSDSIVPGPREDDVYPGVADVDDPEPPPEAA